ncbi:hypothetical protein DL240_10950 [Lujinxingia litoralis]|uniref:histidine kinase n=1 Tax=Lujinxingia litoralis TaxID=2211119 RepID=A0A328C533_9DELT|nr:ATP-binding protein [Lujinxingia litoralis]RAL22359.1 hypothetical protein DL240_10950 [Lujinxingia litoralis]
MSERKRPAKRQSPEPSKPTTATENPLIATPDLVLELDADGTICHVHSGLMRTFFPEAPDEGDEMGSFQALIPSDAVAPIDEALLRALDEQEAQSLENLIPRGNELARFQCRFSPLSADRVLAIVRDLTETFPEQDTLHQSEQRFRSLVENLPAVVYRVRLDKHWTALFISERIEELVGRPARDFLEQRVTISQMIHPEDRAYVQREVKSAIAQRVPFELHYRMIHTDGTVRRIWERGRAIYGRVNQITYLDGAIFDITDLHRLRQKVQTNNKMAAVGSLAAGVAHEINNPLAIVLANLEFVTEELGAVQQAYASDDVVSDAIQDIRQAISKVQSGIDRVRSIIDDLRSFSDAAQNQAEELDMVRLVSWALRRAEPGVLPVASLHKDLQEVPRVWASEVGVVQVLWNLLDNAADAVNHLSPEEARVDVNLRHNPERDLVVLEVRDNGRGMSEDVLSRAFEPFFTTQGIGEGAGLGLFVCQGLVASMGGDITVDSTPDEGTTVKVLLPVHT